jgi:F-type H+-transporting ATPase subunit delta
MKSGPVTQRYAQALFELARESGAGADVARDLERVGAELADAQVVQFFADGRVPLAEKKKRVVALGAGLHPLTANFLRLLVDKRRLEVLAGIGAAYRRLVLGERGAVEGVVETPRPLADGDLAEVAASLGKLFGKEVLLHNRIEPALLAGARIVVANRMLDASALGHLEGLRTKLLSARVTP